MKRRTGLLAGAVVLALASAGVEAVVRPAFAQTNAPDAAQEPLHQIVLSEAQILAFLACQAELQPVLAKTAGEMSGKPDRRIIVQLESIAKKYKFPDYDTLDTVGGNIAIVMDGIDPQTKKYIGAEALLQKQIAEVNADRKMPATQKKQALYELNEALKTIVAVQHPENIDLVLKYYDRIVAASPQSDG